jgi:hypothetical protein
MPSRLLREGILDSSAVNELSFPAEVFYRRLMSVVDDFGRFDGRPAVLRGRLYALKLDTVREADITRWIAECVKAGLIALFAVNGAGSSRWIAVCEKAGLAVSADEKPYVLFPKLGTARAQSSKYPAPPNECGQPPDPVNGCAQSKASVNGCVQPQTGAPYSYSYSDSDSDSDSKSVAAAAADATKIPPELDTEEFRAAWGEWKADRAARRIKPFTPGGEQGQFRKLAKFGPAVAVLAIRESIAQGWQGLFPEKIPKQGTGPPVPAVGAVDASREKTRQMAAALKAKAAPTPGAIPCPAPSSIPSGLSPGSATTAPPSG